MSRYKLNNGLPFSKYYLISGLDRFGLTFKTNVFESKGFSALWMVSGIFKKDSILASLLKLEVVVD